MRNKFVEYRPYVYFFVIYTLSFLLIRLLFIYLLPFFIGMFLSFLMYPVFRFMKKKLSFKPAFSATVITLIIFLAVIVVFSFLVYLLIKESLNLYYNNVDLFKNIFSGYNILDVLKGISISDSMLSTISDTAFAIIRIIPISITLLIVAFTCTIYLINNLSSIIETIWNLFARRSKERAYHVIGTAKNILNKFVRSYLILYFITFVESLFIFILVDIDYPLVFAFLTAIADILPILGPGAVYIPFAIIRFLNGDVFTCIVLLIFWGIVVIIRQITEPKIISDSIKIHPLIILSALYFSIVCSSIWVLFYVVIFALVYKILVESKVLKSIFVYRNNDNAKEY